MSTSDWKKGHNVSYRAGWRAATVHFLGNKCWYPDCEVTGPKNLELCHITPLNRGQGRDTRDWTDLKELRAACKRHHTHVNE